MQTSRRARARRRVGSAFTDGFFQGASRLGRLHPVARPERHGVEVLPDIPYLGTGSGAHLLDVYRPIEPSPLADPRTGLAPAVIYVHGGGFRILSKDTHWLAGLIFARRGYVVFNISYRLAPDHPFPAALEDAAAAYRWVVDHAASYGADPERLVLAGESAGANLATSLTLCATFERPEPFARAVYETGVVPRVALPAMGLLQVSDCARFARRRPLPSFLKDRIEEVSHAYLPDGTPHELADPLVLLESDATPDRPLPPFWSAVGTRDPLLDDTRRLAAALARREVPHQVSYWPGGVHAFHFFVVFPSARAVWTEMLDFTASHLGSPGQPPG